MFQIPTRTVLAPARTGLTKRTKTRREDMTPDRVKASPGPTGLKVLHQRVQFPLMTRKGAEVGKVGEMQSKCPHQTLNTAALTAPKRATAEIIEK